jgi:hypothetical protein
MGVTVSSMPHTTAEEEDRKPEAVSSSIPVEEPSKPQHEYYAIRTCDSLKAPAIFFSWEDCCFYIDQEENEGKVDYKGFNFILDAVKWIEIEIETETTDNGATSKADSTTRGDDFKEKASESSIVAPSKPTTPSNVQINTPATITPPGKSTQVPSQVPFLKVAPFPMPPMVGDAAPVLVNNRRARVPNTGAISAFVKIAASRKRSAKEASLPEYRPSPAPIQNFYSTMAQILQQQQIQIASATKKIQQLQASAVDSPIKTVQGTSMTPLQQRPLAVAAAKSPRALKIQNEARAAARLPPLGFSPPKWNPKSAPNLSPPNSKLAITSRSAPKPAYNATIKPAPKPASNTTSKLAPQSSKTTRGALQRKYKERFTAALRPLTTLPSKDTKPLEAWMVHWDEKLALLAMYNNDEETLPKPPSLLRWEKLVRKEYAKMKAGKDTVLTPLRVAVMAEQGFKFTTRKSKSKSMDEWINEWQEYREKHGKKEPSQYVNYELGTWIKNQRRKYRLVKQGKGTMQMQNDVDRLIVLGFPWDECRKTGLRSKVEGVAQSSNPPTVLATGSKFQLCESMKL